MLAASAAVGAAVVRRRGGARPSDLRTGNGSPTSGPSTTRAIDAGLAPGVTVAFGLPADIQYLRLATQPGDHGVWALSGSLSDRPSNDPPFHGRVWHHDDRTERTRSWPVTLGARFPSIGACRTGIWLAAGDTLIELDPADGSLIAHALPTDTNGAESSDAYTSSPPPAIACDDVDGTVVVTTSSSANYDVFDPRSDRFTSYPLPAGTGANSVAVSSTGEIAVGLTELTPTPPGIDQADEVLLVDGIGGATRVVKVQRSTTVSAAGPSFLVGGAQVIAPGAAKASPGPFGRPALELPHDSGAQRFLLGDGRVVQVKGEESVWVRGLATPHPTPTVPVCPTPLGPSCPITGNMTARVLASAAVNPEGALYLMVHLGPEHPVVLRVPLP